MYIGINSFNEISCFDAEEGFSKKIKEEIGKNAKEYILGVDENEYKDYLIDKYKFEPLKIYIESEVINKPSVSKETLKRGDYIIGEKETYSFTVKYNYTGSADLFKISPNPRIMTSAKIFITEDSVSFSFQLYKKDPVEFKKEKDYKYNAAFTNLNNVNKFANEWNEKLPNIVNRLFQQQKIKYIEENDFFAAINVKINDNTKSVFTVPSVKKKIIPQPIIAKNKEFASEPTVSNIMYEDTLKIIYDLGKGMEKKPSLYKNRDEESLRDHFLSFLETRYEATTATGETFNRNGKTDILLKYAHDNSNLFVAECKFWHGAVEFQKAISQLLGYLTWRDSKTALILFIKNNDFSSVLQVIKKEVKLNPYYIKENGSRGDSSFSYLFHLPQDKDKCIFLEIIAFHFDK